MGRDKKQEKKEKLNGKGKRATINERKRDGEVDNRGRGNEKNNE